MESGSINAVGVWFYSIQTDRYLYLLRNDHKHPNTWGLPGGKVEKNETYLDAVHRECTEELGCMPEYIKLLPIEKFTSNDNVFHYHTFFCLLEKEFHPVLNDEHNGYCWVNTQIHPRPLHPGLWATINMHQVIQKIETIRQNQTSQYEIHSR